MKVSEVIEALESIAPLELAAEWDNVGLLVGSRRWSAGRVMLTVDLTDAVLAEAIEAGAQMIVSYHPVIFEPIRSLTDEAPKTRLILEAARRKIAVYCPHTALDAAPGGLNDWLAEGLGSGRVQPLASFRSLTVGEQYKLVTFCPADAADALRTALGAVGAGHIGAYELCSFEIPGTGTFFGGSATAPAVGLKGRLERVPEIRLEMVCPDAALGEAVAALRQAHPYEEPPIEIYRLEPRPRLDAGEGRCLQLDQKATLQVLIERAKKRLGVSQLGVALGNDAPRRYGTVGLCAGAGGALLESALAAGCELFLTGEMRHHDVLAAQARGCTVMLAGHTNTERGYLKVLRRRLSSALPGAVVTISKKDADPLRVV